jgi:hypothetical protein
MVTQMNTQMNTLIDEPPIIIMPTDWARQGVTGHNVRCVLAFGLAGAVISVWSIGVLTAYGWLGQLW